MNATLAGAWYDALWLGLMLAWFLSGVAVGILYEQRRKYARRRRGI